MPVCTLKGAARLEVKRGAFDLTKFRLPHLVQKLAVEGKTGLLQINKGNGSAVIGFHEGEPDFARFEELEGMEAIVRFAHWRDGMATWSDEEPPLMGNIQPNQVLEIFGSMA